jgi:sulfate adenylyltransferase
VAGSIIPSAHGNRLVDRFVVSDKKNMQDMYTLQVSNELRNDIENIADGIFSPLEGFVGEDDFRSVVKRGRLSNGIPWTVPIILDIDEKEARELKDAGEIALATRGEEEDSNDKFAILHVEEVYSFDKIACAKSIYQTNDIKHPGVEKMVNMKDRLVGGKIDVVKRIEQSPLRRYRMTPAETRAEISRKGWKSVVGFQTRNVPHVAHEMLQKAALNLYDGLLVNPLIGKKKKGDFKDELILSTYLALIDSYYPKQRVMFVTLHTDMRYAGPKEAIHHAIMRKNFGCSHFIVGRDHAGVGNYYHPFAAHEIFNDYPDLEIEPLFFPAFYYCKRCLMYSNERNCPHGQEFREELSGTNMRKMVSSGEMPSNHLMRPEVAKIIVSFKEPFV